MLKGGDGVVAAVANYARRFHACVGPGHMVGSPLGAWLVLALAASAADGDRAAELAEVLGLDLGTARDVAGTLLAEPHPLVSAAGALWHRPGAATAPLRDWIDRLPRPVQTGPIPDQAALDAWASEHTGGLIDRFPTSVDATVLLLLASALATRVSWDAPFETAAAIELGPDSAWATNLRTVLRTPDNRRHVQFIADTTRCGPVAVHAAAARGGLRVVSVIAAAHIEAGDVLDVTHEIAIALADHVRLGERSLFDLPAGAGPAWMITEHATVTTTSHEQRFTTYLPAWSANSEHSLRAPELGFAAAATALGELLGQGAYRFDARQTATARYDANGFEAAAITALSVRASARRRRDGLRRDALIRFAHPYAVVAVTTTPTGALTPHPWHGLPVFSAWITTPDDAEPAN